MTSWNPFARRRRQESELDAELRDHLERALADNLRAGMSEPEARRRAHVSVGGAEQIKERVRDEWTPRALTDVARDLRFGARLALRSPGYAALVLATLALAVGANLTVFTLVNAIWLEPRPVAEPERVVVITDRAVVGDIIDSLNNADLETLRDTELFDDVAGQITGVGLLSDARPRLVIDRVGRAVDVLAVTSNYFPVLGLSIHGRDFTAADDTPGGPAVAIISHHLWRTTFGGSPDALGSTVPTSHEPVRIIGVAPPGFRGARLGELTDIWIPRSLTHRVSANAVASDAAGLSLRHAPMLGLARVKAGIGLAEAAAAVEAVDPERQRYTVFPLASVYGVPNRVTTSIGDYELLGVVAGMALLVLVAGCATLAILVLVHLERRRRELAVRLALGCGRGRLVRGVLIELAGLAVAGVVVALAVATWTLGASRALTLPAGLGLDRLDLSLDWIVVALGLGVGIATMGLAAIVPLARFTRPALAAGLTNANATASESSLRLRRVLLSTHVAATVVVLIGAGLLVRTVAYGLGQGAGFDVGRTLFVTVQPSLMEFYVSEDGLDQPGGKGRKRAAYDRLINELEATSGINAVTIGRAPIGAQAPVARSVTLATPAGQRELTVGFHLAGPGYTDALGLAFLAGQPLNGGSGTLITRSLAQALFGDGNPVGQSFDGGRSIYTVTGVVADFVQGSIRTAAAGGLITETRSVEGAVSGVGALELTVRTEGDASRVVPQVQRIVSAVLPNAVRADVFSGRQLLEQDMGREWLGASFFSGFGLVSLVLGLAGVFGLVSFLAESRRREIGVRMALGATPNRLMRSVVSTGLLPVAVGAVAGLVAAGLLSHTIEAFVHGVGTLDAVSYAGAAILMLLGAAAAGAAAAARIRQVSPMEALRAE